MIIQHVTKNKQIFPNHDHVVKSDQWDPTYSNTHAIYKKTLKFWNLFENFIILKFHEIFEILWKFCIYYKIFEILKFLENFELLKKFWIFWRFWLFFVYCMRITISRISLVWFNHVVMIWENLFIFSNMLYDHAICYFQ
jgi:hypothetical protein